MTRDGTPGEQQAAKSNARVLWREGPMFNDPCIFVTEGGGIGIDVGGFVIVKPVREWHELAQEARPALTVERSEPDDGVVQAAQINLERAWDELKAICKGRMRQGGKDWRNAAGKWLDDGWTLEVNRLATDGCPNACSMLYGAARRGARELGYAKLITYIREDEPGISLAASGWTYEGPIRARSWDMPGRRRIDKTEIVRRGRWSVQLGTPCPITWPIMTDVPLELELASGPPPAGE